MNEQHPTSDEFAFTIVEDEGEYVTIEVSDEDYRREKAAGIEEESLLTPGRHRLKRGGFLARHPELNLKERKQA
jgi:hypothetical protein